MNTRVFENLIPSGSDKTYHDTFTVDNVDTTPQQSILPGLTSINISPNKWKSSDDFSTSIKNYMDGVMKRLVNVSMVRDKFSVFGEMIIEELKCLSPRQQINTKKLMYDALHKGILKKFEHDRKHLSENVDGIVKYNKTQERILIH